MSLVGQQGQRGWKPWHVNVQVVCRPEPSGNITYGGLGSGLQGTAPLPTVVGLAG